MLCCVLVWMNEYIVQIISPTKLWLISRYSHYTLKKRRKMTAQNGHPCTEWFLSLCLQTNCKHMEKQSLICTRKTSFYTDNITSTLTIVVFSINWLWMFALYVRQMCCKLKLKTLNNRKTTALLRNHRKHCVCSDPCICTTQRYSFFFSEVLHEIWRIFPRSFNIVVTSDVPTSYLIFCTKQTRKQSLFYRQHLARHVTFPECLHSPSRMACLCSETLKGVLWSDVHTWIWCRTWTVCFFRSLLRLFSGFPPIWVCEMKVLWKVASSRADDLKPVFLYLAEYSMKNFITTRQYLVNLTCNCWFRMCTQFHQKLVSYKCMLFVDCLVVLREYVVNWARVTKLQGFFLEVIFVLKVMSDVMFATQLLL